MAGLAGKTLFITGASRGIGLAIAKRAARDGANIAVVAKTQAPHPKLEGTIDTAVAEIEAAGAKALALACDIRFEEEIAHAVAATVDAFGGIDICVNNASALSLSVNRGDDEALRSDARRQHAGYLPGHPDVPAPPQEG
jgi:citronellol/citronellal dehydrogenase